LVGWLVRGLVSWFIIIVHHSAKTERLPKAVTPRPARILGQKKGDVRPETPETARKQFVFPQIQAPGLPKQAYFRQKSSESGLFSRFQVLGIE
jgi:hypothetical protein